MTAEEVAGFHRDGFHHLRGVLSQETVDRLCEDLTAIQFINCPWVGPWIDPADPAPVLWMRPRVHGRPAWLATLDAASALTESVTALLGGPPHLEHSMALVKPAKQGQAFPWHQRNLRPGPT